MTRHLRAVILSVSLLTLLTGCVFPLALFGVGRVFFHDRAEGSLVMRGGEVAGSRLIGQNFAQPQYFHPRPSAAGTGYDGTSSGGTNLGPLNKKLIDDVRELADEYRRNNGLAPDAVVPVDAVTRSGSGLDPHISPFNAALQVPRVARARAERVRRPASAGRLHRRKAMGVFGQSAGRGAGTESGARSSAPTIECAGWNISFLSRSSSAWPSR